MYKMYITFNISEDLFLVDRTMRYCFPRGLQSSYITKLFKFERYSLHMEHQLCLFERRQGKEVVTGGKNVNIFISRCFGERLCAP